MAERDLVHFRTTGPAADRRLVREYVLDAVERLPDRPDCEGVGFVPAGQKPGLDGLVLLELHGDVSAVVEHERERWDALVEAGLADDWFLGADEASLDAYWGERGAELRTRIHLLAARASRLVYEAFESRPPPIDASPGERDGRAAPTGVGWWLLLHLLTIQQGYDYRTEVDVYGEGIRNALHRIAGYDGPDAARAKLDEVIASLEVAREELGEDDET